MRELKLTIKQKNKIFFLTFEKMREKITSLEARVFSYFYEPLFVLILILICLIK